MITLDQNRIKTRLVFLTLLILGFSCNISAKTQIETSVKYVASDQIYLNDGKQSGISKGDPGIIMRDNLIIAEIEVVFVSNKSASCIVINSKASIQINDIVLIETEVIESKSKTTQVESIVQTSSRDLPVPEISKAKYKKKIRGYYSAGMYVQDDLSEGDYDYYQPSFVLRNRIENIFNNGINLSFRVRSRKNYRKHELDSDNLDKWNHRIYELSFEYLNPESSIHYNVGRISMNRIAGIGAVDGSIIEYKLSRNLITGLFGGSQPEYNETKINTDEIKTGVFVSYERSIRGNSKLKSTVALAGKYFDGEISKEFIYEQIVYSLSRKITIYESAEISINRGWRKEVEDQLFQISNILVNLRYSPVRVLSVSLGYDNRKLVRTYETKDTPDSLFDDSNRQGLRAGLTFRLPYKVRVYTRYNLRSRNSDDNSSRSFSTGISQLDVFNSGFNLYYRMNSFRNNYIKGFQPSISLNRTLFRRLRINFETGQNNYNISSTNKEYSVNWLRCSSNWQFRNDIFMNLNYEKYFSGDTDYFRVNFELGYRL